MNKRVIFLILLLEIGLPQTSSPQATKESAALQFYNLGLQYRQEGKVDSAVFAFKKALKIDPKFADAHDQLAVVYMNQGTVEGRLRAGWELEKALKLDYYNVEYNVNLGLLLMKKNMLYDAERQFKKVLKLDPHNSTALLNLGLISEELMLHYKDMIDPSNITDMGGDIIELREFGEEYGQEAQRYFARAIELNSSLMPAYYRLGLIEYEKGNIENTANILQKALRVNPEDKNCHLFLGLAYHKLGKNTLAMNEYDKAKSLMSEKEKELFESVELVCSPQERERYENASDSERLELKKVLWRKRDPLYLTEYNERLLEHYGRLAYANLRFALPYLGVEGWQTDRGQVYIRYGPPLSIVKTRPTPISNETWTYQGFRIVFQDRFLSGDFKFRRGFRPQTDYLHRYNALIKQIPEIYDYDYGGKKFDFPYTIAYFRGHNGKTAMDIYYGIPKIPIRVSYSSKTDIATAQIKRGVFLFDEDWKEVFRNVRTRFLSAKLAAVAMKAHVFQGVESIELPPGRYHFAFEVMDEKSGNIGVQRKAIVVESYDSSDLQLSDVILASNIQPKVADGVLSRANLKIDPNLSKSYRKDQPIYIYYEIYNLKKDQSGGTHFRIENTVREKREKKKLVVKMFSELGKLLGVAKGGGGVTTAYEYRGQSETEYHYRVLQIAEAEGDNYELRIKVTDLNSGQSAEKGSEFRIRE